MDEEILKLLENVKNGTVDVGQAYERLRDMPYEDIFHTKIDHHRVVRKGLQEVIFGEGKSIAQILDIVRSMRKKEMDVLVTRVEDEVGSRLCESTPTGNTTGKDAVFISRRQMKRGARERCL
jgi:NCAIR mutase (PurE)-related protein